MFITMYMQINRDVQRPEEGSGQSGIGDTDGCEPSSVSVGIQTIVLCKSSTHSQKRKPKSRSL